MLVSIALACGLVVAVSIVTTLVSGLGSPLAKVPGPWYSRFTHLILKYETIRGRKVFYVHNLHLKYGPIVRITPTEVAIADVGCFAQIHKISSGFYKSPWYDTVTPNRQPGVFAMRDPHQHSARRRLFAQPFSNSALQKNWAAEIRSRVETAVSKIRQDASNGDADVFRWWTLMATDLITHLCFGESFRMLEQGKQSPYIDSIQSWLLMMVLRAELYPVYVLARLMPSERIQRVVRADEVVAKHGSRAVDNMRNASGNAQNLFGQALAMANNQDKATITESDVRDEATNLIVAGSDTTAVTLTYLVWAVLKRPELQRELEEEVAGLSPDLSFDELSHALLLNSVIEETLRLYGAAPGALPRSVPPGGVDMLGHFLPGGTVASTQAYTIHRDPNIFPNPLEFDGYRFIKPDLMTPVQKTAFHPFGAGSRVCLGIHLAYLEMRLAVALFFRECRGIRISDVMTDEMMKEDDRFIIAPRGHCLKVTFG
ncbi:cytochrome P450 [Parathielavia appendiculata]|uniref:Cytochrome P450 n=1 Tax=Parathielavia appendiculata TaxID=2587402 RepID=A0AAN6Z574_9PEZI|nr:cytochrome P450 [Parathielavia appendiculata]